MLNPLNFITKLVKSKNQKELDRITKIVSKINLLEEEIKKLKDDDLYEQCSFHIAEKIASSVIFGVLFNKSHIFKNSSFFKP